MKSIHIKNYKNLEDLQIDNLGRVNLITGKNNAGKSTLLEAIALLVTEGFEFTLTDIVVLRKGGYELEDNNEKSFEILREFFPNRDMSVGKRVSICDENNEVALTPVYYRNELVFDEKEQKKVYQPRIYYHNDTETLGKQKLSKSVLLKSRKWNDQFVENFNDALDYIYDKDNYTYISASGSDRDISDWWQQVDKTPKETHVINILKTIEPGIEAIKFIDSKEHFSAKMAKVPMVRIAGSDEFVRLYSMGDGINRILTIILAMLNCKDGVLLIDEFENGLHYSVQSKLWEVIFTLSEELNVQVFASTHSSDTIRSFIRENKTDTGRFIRLEKRKGKIVSVSYESREKMLFVLSQNIEIR